MNFAKKMLRVSLLLLMTVALTSCDPNVYASVGYSSFGGYGGSGRMGGSISVGGRICC